MFNKTQQKLIKKFANNQLVVPFGNEKMGREVRNILKQHPDKFTWELQSDFSVLVTMN